jgi:hypothetical protein
MNLRPKTRWWLLALAVALVLTMVAGCDTFGESEDSAADSDYSRGMSTGAPDSYGYDGAAPVADEAQESAGVTNGDRLVILTQTLRLEVDDTADSITAIRALVTKHDGIISDLQVATDTEDELYRYDQYGYQSGDGTALRGWVTVRVPADGFDAFVAAVSDLGTIKYQSEGSQDVTQEHVDLSARLANLRAEEARLREFFDAATDVEDMLAIEVELSRVRGEIESLDAQVKYLERQAAMATITIELVEPKPVVRPEGESWGFVEAITDGVRGAAEVLTFAISFIIATAPIWVVALIALLVTRVLLRRRKAHHAGTVGTAGQPAGAPIVMQDPTIVPVAPADSDPEA